MGNQPKHVAKSGTAGRPKLEVIRVTIKEASNERQAPHDRVPNALQETTELLQNKGDCWQ